VDVSKTLYFQFMLHVVLCMLKDIFPVAIL